MSSEQLHAPREWLRRNIPEFATQLATFAAADPIVP